MKPRTSLYLLTLGASLAFACRTETVKRDAREEVEDLLNHQEFEQAVTVAERESRENPDDLGAEAMWRRASAAYLLEQGRRACFERQYEAALGHIRAAWEILPGDPTVAQWREKLLDQLALQHIERGTEWYAEANLDAARAEYELVLQYRPDDPRAKEALANLLLQINYRRGMGERYYDEGVALFRDYWLEQSRSRFAYSGKYEPSDRAKQREDGVKRQIADGRVVLAQELERQGLYAGAANEYRIALLFDTEHAAAKAGLERTRVESEAENLLRKAEMLKMRRRYAEAADTIERGQKLTKLQMETFEGAAAGLEEARLEAQYQRARALESDLRYEEAVIVYGELLKQRNFFRDAITRQETLEGYIKKAASLYEQVQAAPTQEEKVQLLRQIEIVWPEYRNVRDLLKLLAPPATPPAPESKPPR